MRRALEGRIDRRLLVNLRVAPAAARRVVPRRYRPQIVNGWAVAGVCLIRLSEVRPSGVPARLGLTTENMAHRIAVEWDGPSGERQVGVWIPHRHTASGLTVALGGRAYPGVHSRASFDVLDGGDDGLAIDVSTGDGPLVSVGSGPVTDDLPTSSIFSSLAEADQFFREGSCGVSPGRAPGIDEVLHLQVANWDFRPVQLVAARSTLFESWWPSAAGEACWDSAFVMRSVRCRWTSPDARASGPFGSASGQRRSTAPTTGGTIVANGLTT